MTAGDFDDFPPLAVATPSEPVAAAPGRKPRSAGLTWAAFEEPVGVPLVRAASLALGIMRHLGVDSWAEVAALGIEQKFSGGEVIGIALAPDQVQSKFAALILSPEQVLLLNHYAAFLGYLRMKPTVTIAICPNCFTTADEKDQPADGTPLSPIKAHGWSVVSSAVPSKCRVTQGCDAKPVKVAAATKMKTVENPPVLEGV